MTGHANRHASVAQYFAYLLLQRAARLGKCFEARS